MILRECRECKPLLVIAVVAGTRIVIRVADGPCRRSAVSDVHRSLNRLSVIPHGSPDLRTRLRTGCAKHAGAIREATEGHDRTATEDEALTAVVADIEVQRDLSSVHHRDLGHRVGAASERECECEQE